MFTLFLSKRHAENTILISNVYVYITLLAQYCAGDKNREE